MYLPLLFSPSNTLAYGLCELANVFLITCGLCLTLAAMNFNESILSTLILAFVYNRPADVSDNISTEWGGEGSVVNDMRKHFLVQYCRGKKC